MMEVFATLVYDGGIYRFNEFVELIEDIGAFILRREDTGVSTLAVIAIPEDDLATIEEKASEIDGKLTRAPLAGAEIAVVAPSPSGRHLPHPTCDIAEFLRRSGAQTILISLARGVGQEPILQFDEERLINECDAAVFMMGDSKICLQGKKTRMLERLITPVIVTGGPVLSSVSHTFGYVCGFGRKATRLKGSEDLIALGRLVELLGECLAERKRRMYPDLPDVVLPALGQAIERQIPEIKDVVSPSPITIKLNGLRVKLPFDEYAHRIRQIEYNGSHLEDIAAVSRSILKDQILVKIEPIMSNERKNRINIQ